MNWQGYPGKEFQEGFSRAKGISFSKKGLDFFPASFYLSEEEGTISKLERIEEGKFQILRKGGNLHTPFGGFFFLGGYIYVFRLLDQHVL